MIAISLIRSGSNRPLRTINYHWNEAPILVTAEANIGEFSVAVEDRHLLTMAPGKEIHNIGRYPALLSYLQYST